MTIHSDWGDWLPRTIEETEPEGLAVWYLGCNGFALKAADGTTLFIDPYLGLGDPPRTVRMIPVPFEPNDVRDLDAMLITHEHSDHVHAATQAPILARTEAEYYAPEDSLAVTRDEDWVEDWEIDDTQLFAIKEGDSMAIGSLRVSVEPAFDPDALHPVSYVIEHDAGTFYHGGDTKPADVLADIGQRHDIDLGVLAFGSVGLIPDKQTRKPQETRWYSDENQIIDAANALQLDRLIPSHWDMWRGMTADPTALYHHSQSYPYPHQLEIVTIGDRVDL